MKRGLLLFTISPVVTVGLLLSLRALQQKERSSGRDIDVSRCPGYVSYVRTAQGESWNAIGLSDVEHGTRMTPDTVFRIASMSKNFCGVLAALAIEEGLLALETPVSSVLPEFADLRVNDKGCLRKPKTVLTFRHCLSMTGGLATHSPHKASHGFASLSLRDEAREMAALPLSCDPGTRFAYCNSGIDIAAAMLEKVTGRSYAQLLEERVLRPLEMRETTFFPSEDQRRRLAVIYELHETGPSTPLASQSRLSNDTSHVSAAAGLFSTARDLVKFYTMLARHGVGETGVRVLSEGAFRLLQTRQDLSTGRDYSLGMALQGNWLHHCGALCTFGAANFKNGDVMIILSQLAGSGAHDLLKALQRETGHNIAAIGLDYNLL